MGALLTRFFLGFVEAAFFPGALGSVVIGGMLSADEKAMLLKSEEEGAIAVVEATEYGFMEVEEESAGVTHLRKGGKLVQRLNRAFRFWTYCKRIEDETTYGMLSAVVRAVWLAP